MRKTTMTAKLILVAGLTVVTSVQFASSSSWAADCGKTANAKLAPCVSATAKPGPGSSMQTIQQGGAQAQKNAAQTTVESKTALAQSPGHEKRTWVGRTSLTCKKGAITLHMTAGTTQCPDGFQRA
jgi:hypothetical protein